MRLIGLHWHSCKARRQQCGSKHTALLRSSAHLDAQHNESVDGDERQAQQHASNKGGAYLRAPEAASAPAAAGVHATA